MKKLILMMVFGLLTGAQAGSFVVLSPSELTLTTAPVPTPRDGGTTSTKPLRFTMTLGDTDSETGFRRVTSLRLKVGWSCFSLSAADLVALGFCSFDGCKVYAGPHNKPCDYYLTFQRRGPKGQKQEVTVIFSRQRQGIERISNAKR